MSKSTTIVTTTTALSAIATEISSDTSGRTPSKQHILSVFARGIAGPKHDWGLLTGSKKPVIQKGIPEARLSDLRDLSRNAAPSAPAHDLLRFDPDREGITLRAERTPLYTPEMAAYFASKLTGGLISVSEKFSTDPDFNTDIQLMMEPSAIFSSAGDPGLEARSLWAGTPDLIERAAAAYFASSASETVNQRISETIEEWPEDFCGYDFEALYLPHAIIVMPESPLLSLEELAENEIAIADAVRWAEDDPDHEIEDLYGFEAAFRIFIDQALDATGRAEVMAQVEDLLIRWMDHSNNKTPRFGNIRVCEE